MSERITEFLIVEDNPFDAEIALFDFEEHNIAQRFHVAKNAAEAVDYLFDKADYLRDNPPKAIFLDLKLPGINGLELLSFLKSNSLTKRIPVVVLTSSNIQRDLDECERLGVNGFIKKPLGYENFISTIEEIKDCSGT